ncbi:MAG: hypothetical protein JSS07_01865 [Proteobacteria bacterium]|nr:hypothetical protein [Pseudomonadota bacterium]
MAIASAQPSHIDNFHVIASFIALAVLQEDDYFQDLPENWQQIIHKIKEKLSAKEQRARFEEKLTDIAHGETGGEVKGALPDAIKQLISVLNNSVPSQTSPTASLSAIDKFSRSYTPLGAHGKHTLKPREEKQIEERSSPRLVLPPVN